MNLYIKASMDSSQSGLEQLPKQSLAVTTFTLQMKTYTVYMKEK